jgi:hypothetical protein
MAATHCCLFQARPYRMGGYHFLFRQNSIGRTMHCRPIQSSPMVASKNNFVHGADDVQSSMRVTDTG